MSGVTVRPRITLLAVLALLGALALAASAALVIWLNVRGEDRIVATSDVSGPDAIERGAYLARIGNCAGCHTDRGGRPYAGGKGIETPFGTVYASNLTPDAQTGIGAWSSADFWRALHHGRSRDGRLLYPAFPYPNYTQVSRDDADAMFAFLRSQVPVEHPNPTHALRWPYSKQAALAVWRALYFKPVAFEPDAGQAADWNRGAYLVNGLGHCVACHSPRNLLGATESEGELSGGLIPMQHWYAPSLTDAREAGVGDWELADIAQLLQTGRTTRGAMLVSVMGPMAEVVFRSTQYLSADDARAMATYLKQLPQAQVVAAKAPPAGSVDDGLLARGAKLYEDRCSTCHGNAGEGALPAYPPLAGNRAVTMDSPANVIRVVIGGGYLPATAGNPRPHGMPPFGQSLSDEEIAAVSSFVRHSWGNQADPVSALAVRQSR